MSDAVSALREAFGSSPETSTLKGLVAFTRGWLEESDNTPTATLQVGCTAMVTRLQQARIDTGADLDKAGNLEPELRAAIEESYNAYDEIEEVVTSMTTAVSNNDRDEVARLLDLLVEGAENLSQAQSAMDDWLKNPVLRCPRCGSSQSDPCNGCGLELLIPDPKAAFGLPQQTATLPTEYGPVHQTYLATTRGDATLSVLIGALKSLEGHFRNLLAMVNASLQEEPEAENLVKLQEVLETALEGSARMREAESSRKAVDLRLGWEQIFTAGAEHYRLTGALVQQLGGDEQKQLIQARRQQQQIQDQVNLTGED